MKTIEVTDEMYNSLMELSKEMTTQDMRSTAMPHMFQIQTTEQTPAGDGCGTEAWHCDGSVIWEEEDIMAAVLEYKEWDRLEEEDAEGRYKELSDEEKDEILEVNYSKIWFEETEKYQNCFFTSKACQEHIDSNSYHYRKPVNYLNHAFRNTEMELVATFLCELSGGKLHR